MGRITAFVVGGLVGAVGALMMSPGTGSQNRDRVTEVLSTNYPEQTAAVQERAGQVVGAAAANSTKVINTVVDGAGDLKSNVTSRAQQMASDGSQAFTNQTDELRAKIDSARDRIAAQVKKNADETAANVEQGEAEVVEEAAEAVEAAEEKAEEAAE